MGVCGLGQEDLPDTGTQPRDPPWARQATAGLIWAPGSLTGTSTGPVSPSLGVDPINRLSLALGLKAKGDVRPPKPGGWAAACPHSRGQGEGQRSLHGTPACPADL